jgi:serine/threonine protein kinase
MNSIGRYQLVEKLGQGGMGIVYRAFDTLLQRTVALKVISGTIEVGGEQRERFFREARAAGQLSHANIITIHDLGEHEGQPYLAMEYLEGEDLQRRLTGAPMSLLKKVDLAIEICQGLEYAHAHGVVHRDIKPANIFLTQKGTAKILDFGLARLVTSELTSSNMMMGTVNYMAPEQVRGERADHRSDIFSAGVVIYELLGGRKAFDAESFAATLFKILQEEPEPLATLDPGLPPDLVEVVKRALAKPRDERYQQMADMVQDLILCRQEVVAHEAFAARPPSGGSRAETIAAPRPPSGQSIASDAPTIAHTPTPFPPSQPPAYVTTPPQPKVEAAPARKPTAMWIPAAAIVVVIAAAGIWAMWKDAPAAPDTSATDAPPAVTPPASAPAPTPPPPQPAATITADTTPKPGANAEEARAKTGQAKVAARAANAQKLAASAYSAATDAERAGERLLSAGKSADAIVKFYEAQGLFRSAELSAQAEAANRAKSAQPSPTSAAPQPAPVQPQPQPAPPPPSTRAQEPTTPTMTPPQQPAVKPPDAQPTQPPPPTAKTGDPVPVNPPAEVSKPPAPATPAEPTPEAAIAEVLTRYERAIESRDLAAMKRVWPGMPASQESAFKNEFSHTSRIGVDITSPKITVTGTTATVTFVRRYEAVTTDGQRLNSASNATMQLKHASGWVIDQVRFEPIR